MEDAELVAFQKLCEKHLTFRKIDGRMLSGEQKERLKLPDVV